MRFWRRLFTGLIVLATALCLAVAGYGYSVWNPRLPAMLVARVHTRAAQNGGYVPLSRIPKFLQRALIATEDRNFYQDEGINIEGTLRALYVDLIHRKFLQGGSTLTQQLVKDMFLSDQKTLQRKFVQVVDAIMVSRALDKNEILDLYLNEVYLGNGAYGVGAAARIYFAKPPQDLTKTQCALLAGLPQAPSLYDPLVNLTLARTRQREVLSSMVAARFISEREALFLSRAPLGLVRP